MSRETKHLTLRMAADVDWAVEADFTLVVDPTRGEVFRLTGLEQVLWDSLELGFSFIRMRKMVEALGRLPPEEAEREMLAIWREWQMLGLVEMDGDTHG